ncbi:MAG TPA: hypothetical protein PK156_28930 [Polyangium sp.]|nr:hypothetical protein [Polyangium sp.]
MSRKLIRLDLLKQVVSGANQVFTTKDVSEDARMRRAHADLVDHSHYHAFVGGALSDHHVVLDIIETQKGTRRGSRWAKQSGERTPAADKKPHASTAKNDVPAITSLPQMPTEDARNSSLIILMLFAQAYYKMLESVISMASWVTAVDVELNSSYLSIVSNTTNLLRNDKNLADFPITFEPFFPNLYPSTIADAEWAEMVAPHAEQFLSTVQAYVHSKGVYEPEEGSPGWILVQLFRTDAETAIERGIAYNKQMREHLQKMLSHTSADRPRWDETWHRLREWTNGQAPSERLAAQILLGEGYSKLDPSHPLGGPDGCKDALCAKDGKTWVMAAYFPRGQQKLRTIKKKFNNDLRGVTKNGAHGLAFVTNQEFSDSERMLLREAAAPVSVDLFHLERITAILDKPTMAPVRKQFLLIE